MSATTSQPSNRYQFVAGNLSLDFANTVDWRESQQPVELLPAYSDLLTWGGEAGLLDTGDAGRLLRIAGDEPDATVAIHARAVAVREAIFRIFRGVARLEPATADDLKLLNDEFARACQHRRIVARPDGYAWEWAGQGAALEQVLWDVVHSAAELLTSDGLVRVRQCAGDPCGWLFFDTSRNRSRRWCNMDGCGNRAKARRYYERQRVRRDVQPSIRR